MLTVFLNDLILILPKTETVSPFETTQIHSAQVIYVESRVEKFPPTLKFRLAYGQYNLRPLTHKFWLTDAHFIDI